jgi:ornithine cyclodeaminase/alanine dehydrogenase-like protein (mu-crystallin family)
MEVPRQPALLLTASDLEPLRADLAAMDGALTAVEEAIIAQSEGRIRQGRLVDRVEGEFEGIRLSLLAGGGLHSGMRIFGNPPHTRAFLLFDGVTRAMLALMDYGILNSLRVGATAGVAARHLAPAGARVMGLLGSGWQAQPQVFAMRRAVPSLELIRVFSPTREHREAFAREMTRELGIAVKPVGTVREALSGADIVDLCAPGHFDVREPLFAADSVRSGALVISMATNQYDAEFVRGTRVVTTSWDQLSDPSSPKPPFDSLIARGEITKDDVTDFGEVIVSGANPRRTSSETVIYHLEGGTVQDLFVATWGYNWAKSKSLGMPFDLSA